MKSTPEPGQGQMPTPEGYSEALQQGDNREKAVALRKRLIDLGYLTGKANGEYGPRTVDAVKWFQQKAGLEITGIADEQTQRASFSDTTATPEPTAAPRPTSKPTSKSFHSADLQDLAKGDKGDDAKIYQKPDYNAVARDPSACKGDLITFQGRIVQVMESGRNIVFRIATRGNHDNVVYCTFTAPTNYSRILEKTG